MELITFQVKEKSKIELFRDVWICTTANNTVHREGMRGVKREKILTFFVKSMLTGVHGRNIIYLYEFLSSAIRESILKYIPTRYKKTPFFRQNGALYLVYNMQFYLKQQRREKENRRSNISWNGGFFMCVLISSAGRHNLVPQHASCRGTELENHQ